MATPQNKAFCVLEFAKASATATVQRAFGTEFIIDPAYHESIQRWVRQFKENGCLCKENSPGRPCVSEEHVETIHDAFERSPRKFTRRANLQLEMFVCLFVVTLPLPRDGGTACRQPN